MKRVKMYEIPSEIGAGTRGASTGPDAIRIAALTAGSKIFGEWPNELIQVENHLLWQEDNYPRAHFIPGIVKIYERVCSKLSEHLQSRTDFPIIISADHATAGGTIAGIKSADPSKRIGVIWIDAHADLHSPFTSPSGNVHGMPLATALGEDNMEQKRQEVDSVTLSYWTKLKETGGISPKINPEDIVFIGVRDTEEQEEFLMHRHRMPNFKVAEVRSKGATAIAEQALAHLSDCDIIYISFDVDSMDPDAVSYGTGTPVKDGLFEAEATELITTMLGSDKVACLEIVEVNPQLDNRGNAMAEATFRVLSNAIETLTAQPSLS